MINILKDSQYFKKNKTFQFFFQSNAQKPSRINILYKSLSKICQISTKSISDPQFYKSVVTFLNTAISSVDFVEDAINSEDMTRTEKREDDLIDISAVDDIFGMASGNVNSGISLLKKALPQEEKSKVQFVEKVIKEIQDLGVFGKTKLTDLVLQKQTTQDDEMQLIIKRISEGKASSRDLFKAIDNEGDKSGSISKSEFDSLSKRIGMNFTEHRINEIFSSIKE